MRTSFARFFSVAFHPLLMPTLLFGVLLYWAPGVVGMDAFSTSLRGSLLVLIFIGTFAVPALLIYYLYRSGYVSSLQLNTLSDRRLPYFLTALVYFFLSYLFGFQMQLISTVAPEIAILLGSIALSILLVGSISLYWQISAHGVGIGGVVGGIAGVMLKFGQTELFWPLLVMVLMTGCVASARLRLNAHTLLQVGVGLLLGLVISAVAVVWWV